MSMIRQKVPVAGMRNEFFAKDIQKVLARWRSDVRDSHAKECFMFLSRFATYSKGTPTLATDQQLTAHYWPKFLRLYLKHGQFFTELFATIERLQAIPPNVTERMVQAAATIPVTEKYETVAANVGIKGLTGRHVTKRVSEVIEKRNLVLKKWKSRSKSHTKSKTM